MPGRYEGPGYPDTLCSARRNMRLPQRWLWHRLRPRGYGTEGVEPVERYLRRVTRLLPAWPVSAIEQLLYHANLSAPMSPGGAKAGAQPPIENGSPRQHEENNHRKSSPKCPDVVAQAEIWADTWSVFLWLLPAARRPSRRRLRKVGLVLSRIPTLNSLR